MKKEKKENWLGVTSRSEDREISWSLVISLLYRASHWMHIDTECVEVRCDVVHDTATQCNVTLFMQEKKRTALNIA